MPYSNVPEDKWDEMDSCIERVMDEQDVEKERAIAICHTSIVGKSIPFYITKVQKFQGTYRWQARANTGEFDLVQERFDETFFDDLVANFAKWKENQSKAQDSQFPVPILDISHYSLFLPKSQRDLARVGWVDLLWRSGRELFAKGFYDNTPHGLLAANAALKRQPEDRRVSIVVFPDYSLAKREHERLVYYGEGGEGKAYLDSMAMTSQPCDPGTELEVSIMSEKAKALEDDALKVLGGGEDAEKYVKQLESARAKSKTSAPDGVVIKAEEEEGSGETQTQTQTQTDTDLETEPETDEEKDKVDVQPDDHADLILFDEDEEGFEAVEEEEAESKTQATKKIGDRTHSRGDFLVQGETDKPTTWHLPVKVNGKPDRGLAGAAYAALFKNYRGKQYSGPDAEQAKAKLKALYSSQGWDWPGEDEAKSAVAKAVAEFLPQIAKAIDTRIEEFTSKVIAPLGDKLKSIEKLEQRVDVLGKSETEKAAAALVSDGDWLTKMLSENSVQLRNQEATGEKVKGAEADKADSGFARTYGPEPGKE